jgi:hypothetical protein
LILNDINDFQLLLRPGFQNVRLAKLVPKPIPPMDTGTPLHEYVQVQGVFCHTNAITPT